MAGRPRKAAGDHYAPITVRWPPDELARLQWLAERRQTALAQVVRDAVADAVRREERRARAEG